VGAPPPPRQTGNYALQPIFLILPPGNYSFWRQLRRQFRARSPNATCATMATAAVNNRGEVLQIRSPAEFFAENQNIAGFDNPGKCLYTTIRELVENALDAAEAISVLPDISVSITEMDEKTFNRERGMTSIKRVDHDLYSSAKDNGAGMAHDKIPDMFGRVLAGSKYGVRQTRGKFGLGAKMALIWSKKSTGMPIEISSAHTRKKGITPASVSYCKLDIDIFKNEPNVLVHTKRPNEAGWAGSEITLTIGGNWTTYKARILQYFQQLAIITPYAQFALTFFKTSSGTPAGEEPQKQLDFSIRYDRRSDQMPPLAQLVKHHPSALNDLLLKQLILTSKHDELLKFVCNDLSNIDTTLAQRVFAELGSPFAADMPIRSLTTKQIHQLVQFFKQVHFKAPDGKWLSPAGEYNLRLGIMKELEPELVATHTEKPAVFEGHSFIVEAAVSIGGKKVKEGLNIYRFANRIPLLFEAGGDVVTRTAAKQINWSYYKIDQKRDKIGVFVSIVSTKIPFKGTGKEYIGDDIVEMKLAVKHVITQCCSQLKQKLMKSNRLKENAARKKNLTKYIPDVSRALYGVLAQMQEQQAAAAQQGSSSQQLQHFSTNQSSIWTANDDPEFQRMREQLFREIKSKTFTEKGLQAKLHDAVQKADEEATLEHVAAAGRDSTKEVSVFIQPLDHKQAFVDNGALGTAMLSHPLVLLSFFPSALQVPKS
ncbi:TPA: hypothetical protein N0F65_000105, partial [Lagenidium giganteum]